MNKVTGLLVNMVLLTVGVGSGLVFTRPEGDLFPVGYFHVFGALVTLPAMVVLLVWCLSRCAPMAKKWPRPSLLSNPLNFEAAPLTLFFVLGLTFVVSGTVGLTGRVVLRRPFDLSPLYFITLGIGVLIGLRLAMFAFRSRMAS